MKLILLVLLVCLAGSLGKSTKKSQKDSLGKEEKGNKKKAIIAIEIIDSSENGTSKSGKKRTIEASLGYGYQNSFNVKPKYEVYKYSQHDIPPFKGNYESSGQGFRKNFGQNVQNSGQNYQIQKSVQYDLGRIATQKAQDSPVSKLNQYYQHGATLFSSLDQNGQVGQLSPQIPQQTPDQMVPVIFLRVYTHQLGQTSPLYPNIPSTHQFSHLRNLNLQNLLTNYMKTHQPQTQHYQPQQHFYQQQYVQPQYYQPKPQYYQPQPQYYQPQQVYYQPQPRPHYHDDGLQTHENYPDDAHTKVIFHNPPKKPQKFRIVVPENTFSKVEIQEHVAQPQYYYPEPQYQQQEPHEVQYQEVQYEGEQKPHQVRAQSEVYPQEVQYEATAKPQSDYHRLRPEVQYQAGYEEQAQSSMSGEVRKTSEDLGRDLHAKVFNYHAHGGEDGAKKAKGRRRAARLSEPQNV